MRTTIKSIKLERLILVLATLSFGLPSHAVPYATCLTNQSGTVSFRLNEFAEDVKIIGNGGALVQDLGSLSAGLTVVDLTAAGLTAGPFRVSVYKSGSGFISEIFPRIAFNSPRDVAINANPSSPFFGRVYVANSVSGTKGDGIYIYNSDLSNPFAPSPNLRTGGYNFVSPLSAGDNGLTPFRVSIGADDQVYICDYSTNSGNLIVTDPDVTTFGYVLKPLSGLADAPVGINNVHGSIGGVVVTGSLAGGNLVVYTMDEDYQTDPTSTILGELQFPELHSLWQYDIGSGPLPWANPPVKKLMTPSINWVVAQNEKIVRGPNGYLYFNQRRANATAPCFSGTYSPTLMIVDPATFIPTADYPTYDNSCFVRHPNIGGFIWDSQTASIAFSGGTVTDYFADCNGMAVSPDGRYIAGISFNANRVIVCPLVNGIPDFAGRQTLSLGGASAGRAVGWDAADNLYVVSSGLQTLRVYSLGLNATAITSSDGTFQLLRITCPTSVYVGNDLGVCSAQVSYATPVGTGNGPGIVTVQTAGLPSGAAFPVGFTINTFVVSDPAGNTMECSSYVSVVDVEPPTITCPADITVPAVSPAGAEVPYTSTATDNCSAFTDCWPASGSIFPIGTTVVSCYAYDGNYNFANCYFNVVVKGAAEQINDLIVMVQNSGIKPGTVSSLLGKLQDAKFLLSKQNIVGTCGKLKDFIDAVSAQASKKQITSEQAEQFIKDAQRIRAVIGC